MAPRYIPRRNKNVCLHKDLYINVQRSIIHNSQNVETTTCPSIDKCINKMWHIQITENHLATKGNYWYTLYNMDEP